MTTLDVSPRARRVDARAFGARHRRGLIALTELVVVLTVWWLVVDGFTLVNPVFYPSPVDVVTAFWDLLTSGRLLTDIGTSAKCWAIGFALGMVFGTLAGLIIGTSAGANRLVMPLLWAAWATPLIALRPMLSVWFGFGQMPIIVLVFISTVIPVALNTVAGCKGVRPSMLNAARVYGATRVQVYRHIRLPWAIPPVLSGARIAVHSSLVALLVAEMVGQPSGVGALIVVSTSRFETADAFVGIILYIIAGVALIRVLDAVERRVARWRAVAA